MADPASTQYRATFIPIDRRFALAANQPLPDRVQGAALFADVSGFTPLTEAFVRALGPKRGTEEFLVILNQVYEVLIGQVHRYRGSVISFSGDAISCWFDADDGRRALSAALAMQRGMSRFARVPIPDGRAITLAVKIGVSVGPARRFVVGDPRHKRIDVLAGRAVDQVALAEQQARKGEVVAPEAVLHGCAGEVEAGEWRVHQSSGARFAVVKSLANLAAPQPWPPEPLLPEHVVDEWQVEAVRQRLHKGRALFLAELRPAVALFLKFGGLDYDQDDQAGSKLDAYIRWVQGVLARYEGILLQISMGDKGSYLYAVFGAPVAHDDEVLRAISAAVALKDLPGKLQYIRNVQIGITQGQMRTGESGASTRQTYAVLGDKANLAARLMLLPRPGEIYCDRAVYQAARHRWQFEALPAARVKGKASLIRPYRLMGPVGSTGQLTVSPQEMVGRQAERAYLEKSLRAVKQGEQRFMMIEGEAGIGKSRLVGALGGLLRQHELVGLLGYGQSIERQTPYRAWRDILLTYFGVEKLKDPRQRRLQIREFVAETVPDQLPRLPVLEDILHLGFEENELTRNLPTDLRRQNVFSLVLALMRAWAREQPLILVLEDAHWLDSLSWELSLQIARGLQASGEPLLFVWVNRPIEPLSALVQYQRALQKLPSWKTLTLEALPHNEMVALIGQELRISPDDLPPDLVTFVASRAEGNPFFAQELLFALREQNLLRIEEHDSGARRVAAFRLGEASRVLPDTLQGLILTRIDGLSPRQKFVLKVAAVVGRTFSINPLHYVMNVHVNLQRARLVQHLDHFVQLDLVQLESQEPELTYLFKHIITQEVAYQTLLYAQRRQLHRAVAEWYELTYGELETLGRGSPQVRRVDDYAVGTPPSLAPFLPLLVHHYHHAEVFDKELLFARLAADQARTQYANEEALAYLSRAIELEQDETRRYHLHLAREEIYGLLGRREDQRRELETLAGFSSVREHAPRRASVLLRRAAFAKLTGAYSEALESARAVIAIGREENDPMLAARGEWVQGQILVQMGDYAHAVEHFERVLPPFREAGTREDVAAILGDFGLAFFYQGDYVQSIHYFERALAIAHEIGLRRAEIQFLGNLAGASWALGAMEESINHYRQVLAISREIGDRRAEGITLGNLGIAYRFSRDLNRAIEYLEQALQISREIGDRRKEATWLGNLGGVFLFAGQPEKSIRYFERALDICREIGNRNGEASWLEELSMSYRLNGSLERAVALSEESLALRRQIGNRHGEANCLENLGLIYADMRRWDQAYAFFQQALSLRRELNQPHLAIDALAGLAGVAWQEKRLQQAGRYVDEIWEYWRRHPTLEGTVYPLRALWIAYQVFQELDQPRAAQLIQCAQTMLSEQAGKISEPSMRESFLNNIPEHKAIAGVGMAKEMR